MECRFDFHPLESDQRQSTVEQWHPHKSLSLWALECLQHFVPYFPIAGQVQNPIETEADHLALF